MSMIKEPAADGSGVKHDDGKLPWHLLPIDALEEVVKVLQFGAAKYTANNWRGGMQWSRLIRAASGHIFAYYRGEDSDPETGYSHLAHAVCCLLFLLSLRRLYPQGDDRAEHQGLPE
ncbi:MAG: dATP/dGTP diphosphohydrolase domain-containing protein [Pseudomonadota bacterium]